MKILRQDSVPTLEDTEHLNVINGETVLIEAEPGIVPFPKKGARWRV